MNRGDALCTVVGGESVTNQVMHVELLEVEVFLTVRRFTPAVDEIDGSCTEDCVSFEVSAIPDVIRELRRIWRFHNSMALERLLREEPNQ